MNILHQILLQPTDVLFFRDGRPMGGSLAGHTAAWPLPDVTNHALLAALHRADLEAATGQKLHSHRQGRSGRYDDSKPEKKFGSLLTAGPFPLRLGGTGYQPVASGNLPDAPHWFFTRPKDAQLNSSVAVTLRPGPANWRKTSSLPAPLQYAVANTQPPDKDAGGEPWMSEVAFKAYLMDSVPGAQPAASPSGEDFLRDSDLADTEHAIGIGIDPDTQTTGQGEATGKIYSAHYLRLREGFRLGLFAEAMDKLNGDPNNKRDLIAALFNGHPQSLIVGGQQRICTAQRKDIPSEGLPLPRGLATGFNTHGDGEHKRLLVKWVLLTPAIWPEIPAKKKDGADQTPHPGGWLPNWIEAQTGAVLLRYRSGRIRRDYSQPKARRIAENESPIGAHLVAAIVPKPIPVTGWALPNDTDRTEGGAKSTHLAVPAGAVYYFEADSPEDAARLAAALNWHGTTPGTEIKNRRSTLLGEKGYGLGVCGTWSFFPQAANPAR